MLNDHWKRIKDQLEIYADKYNQPDFIQDDPISIPHQFSNPKDIEVIGFWVAILSWGNRKSIMNSGRNLCGLMDNSPYDFIIHHQESDRARFEKFVHRTFQYTDSLYFLEFLQYWFQNYDTLESAFLKPDDNPKSNPMELMLENFFLNFFSRSEIPDRTRKHISRPSTGSRCKRLLMFLRWMVRKDSKGVDFGIWQQILPSQLMLPLDVHVERTARRLGLLQRKNLDWKAVQELSEQCSYLNPTDPCLYDFALFGMSLELKNSNY